VNIFADSDVEIQPPHLQLNMSEGLLPSFLSNLNAHDPVGFGLW